VKRLIFSALFLLASKSFAASPNCQSWPMNMAEVWLKNNNIIDIQSIDKEKTRSTLLATEKKNGDLYTQVYFFTFYGKDGKSFDVITQSDATTEECSASEVNVFLVSKHEINH